MNPHELWDIGPICGDNLISDADDTWTVTTASLKFIQKFIKLGYYFPSSGQLEK